MSLFNNNQQTIQQAPSTSLYPNVQSQQSLYQRPLSTQRTSILSTPLPFRQQSTVVPNTPRNTAVNADVTTNNRQSSAVPQTPAQPIELPKAAHVTPSVTLHSLIEQRDTSLLNQTEIEQKKIVTIYGFTLDQLDIVLPRFELIGDIIDIDKSDHTKSTNRRIQPNYVHLTYKHSIHAQIATQLNGTIINDLMIGVQYMQSPVELNVEKLKQSTTTHNVNPIHTVSTNIYVPQSNIGFTQRLYNYLTQCMLLQRILWCINPNCC